MNKKEKKDDIFFRFWFFRYNLFEDKLIFLMNGKKIFTKIKYFKVFLEKIWA